MWYTGLIPRPHFSFPYSEKECGQETDGTLALINISSLALRNGTQQFVFKVTQNNNRKSLSVFV